MQDYNGDGLLDNADALIWDDRENGGRGFKAWTAIDHPQLGRVEIGAFHPKFFAQNGPPTVLEHWVSRQALFNLELALHLPELDLSDATVRRLTRNADSTTWEITVRWRNTGRLPTALRQAQLVKIVQEDQVRLDFASELTRGDSPRLRIVQPSSREKTITAGWTEPGQTRTVSFRVRTYGEEGARGEVVLSSTRGGLIRKEFQLGTVSAEGSASN
jgi:hypothetical protein